MSLAPQVQEQCYHCHRPFEPHCPVCGSLRKYGLSSRTDTVSRPDGSLVHLRVFRCLTCTNVYNDDEWMFRCQAPPQRLGRKPRTKREAQQRAQEQLEAIQKQGLEAGPPDLVARALELQKRMGIDPNATYDEPVQEKPDLNRLPQTVEEWEAVKPKDKNWVNPWTNNNKEG